MTTTLGPALGDDADDLGGGYCIYGLLAMLMMLMMPVALPLCCCRRPKPKIGKQTDESAEDDPEETPEERDLEGTIGTCHTCHEKEVQEGRRSQEPRQQEQPPHGQCARDEVWGVSTVGMLASRDCKALRHSRTIESKRPCPCCCPA